MKPPQKLQELQNAYKSGQLNKKKYIEKQHALNHRKLFEYSTYIKTSDIASITISDDTVVMTTRKNGIKMICDKDDLRIIPIEILNFSEYETPFLNLIKKAIIKNQGKKFVFFDIGANIGWYTLNAAQASEKIEIHAFEPIPKTFNYLKQNVKINQTKNVILNNFGLADEEKKAVFYTYKEGYGNASLANLSEATNTEKNICRITTIDKYVSKHNINVNCIKCDVEGAELFVFQGGLKTIKRDKPIIFTEMLRKWSNKFNYHPNKIIKLFHELDYKCYIIKNSKLTPFHEMDEKTQDTNFIFLPSTISSII